MFVCTVLALLTIASASAQDAEVAPVPEPAVVADPERSVCLADGQLLRVEDVEDVDSGRTVRIEGANVRIPDLAAGADCSALHPAEALDPRAVRTLVLADGQHLHGTPTELPDGFAVALLDAHRIYLPAAAVAEVRPLSKGVTGLEALSADRARARRRQWVGIASGIGLGAASAATFGLAVTGVVRAMPEREQGR